MSKCEDVFIDAKNGSTFACEKQSGHVGWHLVDNELIYAQWAKTYRTVIIKEFIRRD